MTLNPQQSAVIEILMAARRIADYAREEGVLREKTLMRPTCTHMGAVLADSVLQAGLNYSTVVLPRVRTILRTYPEIDTIAAVIRLIQQRKTEAFLNWKHCEKVARFENLAAFLHEKGVHDADNLRTGLTSEEFCIEMMSVHGIGPKTVDYMACLIGVDSIAVDRHVRNFARKVGVDKKDYTFLRNTFCCAADLLEVPRRQFDAWLWRRAAVASSSQLELIL